jgi:hypothetical protein
MQCIIKLATESLPVSEKTENMEKPVSMCPFLNHRNRGGKVQPANPANGLTTINSFNSSINSEILSISNLP